MQFNACSDIGFPTSCPLFGFASAFYSDDFVFVQQFLVKLMTARRFSKSNSLCLLGFCNFWCHPDFVISPTGRCHLLLGYSDNTSSSSDRYYLL